VIEELWEDDCLKIRLAGVPGTDQTYWLHVPKGYTLAEMEATNAKATRRVKQDLTAVAVAFEDRDASIILRFGANDRLK